MGISRNGFGSRMSSSTTRAWKISSYIMTSAWTTSGTMWKKKTNVQTYRCFSCLYLPPFIYSPKKNMGTYLPTCPRICHLFFRFSVASPDYTCVVW
jgi:hypothetical protein